jgi:glutamate-ammonia-ligase adenylyltransferase
MPKRHLGSDGLPLDLAQHFCVVAYGKLGGKELGYGSDLDVVFLYQDEHPDAAQTYIALVRKLLTCLSVKTSEGDLYEIDTALRPNGNSGLLVTSMASYKKYQLQLGSNSAWTWELQAMTRARCVYGANSLVAEFDAIRAQVLCTERDSTALKAEITAMRQKLYVAYPAPEGQFDIKHSQGGMMDAEFAVQYLVLQYARNNSALTLNIGNIELLKLAQSFGLLPSNVGSQAADAYQLLRERQHAARLQEVKALLPGSELSSERAAITALWQAVFE